MRPDGFIGHVVFWDQPLSCRRLVYYNVTSRHAEMTGTIQPPLLAWAWRLAVGDPAAEPRIAAHHEWLRANRDLDGDGLLWLVQPDESGLDSSPKFDPVWGRLKHGGYGFPLLIARNRRLGWDARRIRDRGGPVLVRGDDQRALGPGADRRGEPSITPAIVERLWDERRGLFLDEVQHRAARAPAGLDLGGALAARAARPARGDRPPAGPEHLLDPQRYWPPIRRRRSRPEPASSRTGGPGWRLPLLA